MPFRSELDVIRAEMERDRSEFQRRLDEKEGELMTLREESRRGRSALGGRYSNHRIV